VLLDLNMPVKNGWDTFEHARRTSPKSSTMPLAIIPKPDKFETARDPVGTNEALTVQGQRPSQPHAVISIAGFHPPPAGWDHAGINE
jgi:hypothetical protein